MLTRGKSVSLHPFPVSPSSPLIQLNSIHTHVYIPTHMLVNSYTHCEKDCATLQGLPSEPPAQDVEGQRNQLTETGSDKRDEKMQLWDMTREKDQVGCQ